jgi:hypothetical protein
MFLVLALFSHMERLSHRALNRKKQASPMSFYRALSEGYFFCSGGRYPFTPLHDVQGTILTGYISSGLALGLLILILSRPCLTGLTDNMSAVIPNKWVAFSTQLLTGYIFGSLALGLLIFCENISCTCLSRA